jgi:DNA-binding NtrC family response regulator
MLTQKKMLLIDGDEGIRKSLALFFGSRNCCLHTVENGAQGLTAINNALYDIIICEELLPDMRGLNFFKILTTRGYKTLKILITWYGNNATSVKVRQQNIDCLLTKPFSGEEVEAAMIRLIKAETLAQEADL